MQWSAKLQVKLYVVLINAENYFILIQYIVHYFYRFLSVTWLCGVVFKALGWSETWAITAVASSEALNLRSLWEDCHCNELMALFCRNVSSKSQKTDSSSPDQAADNFFFSVSLSLSHCLVLFQNLDSPSVVMVWLRLMNSVTVAIAINARTSAAMMPMRQRNWSVNWSQTFDAGAQ